MFPSLCSDEPVRGCDSVRLMKGYRSFALLVSSCMIKSSYKTQLRSEISGSLLRNARAGVKTQRLPASTFWYTANVFLAHACQE
jgi:hypothetical protein